MYESSDKTVLTVNKWVGEEGTSYTYSIRRGNDTEGYQQVAHGQTRQLDVHQVASQRYIVLTDNGVMDGYIDEVRGRA